MFADKLIGAVRYGGLRGVVRTAVWGRCADIGARLAVRVAGRVGLRGGHAPGPQTALDCAAPRSPSTRKGSLRAGATRRAGDCEAGAVRSGGARAIGAVRWPA